MIPAQKHVRLLKNEPREVLQRGFFSGLGLIFRCSILFLYHFISTRSSFIPPEFGIEVGVARGIAPTVSCSVPSLPARTVR